MSTKRDHQLYIGEKVYDSSNYAWGKITELNHIYGTIIDNKGNTYKAPKGYLYQIAKGYHDLRTNKILCYEHKISEYPFYSPSLGENLYYNETDADFPTPEEIERNLARRKRDRENEKAIRRLIRRLKEIAPTKIGLDIKKSRLRLFNPWFFEDDSIPLTIPFTANNKGRYQCVIGSERNWLRFNVSTNPKTGIITNIDLCKVDVYLEGELSEKVNILECSSIKHRY